MPDEYISREAALEITTRTCGDYAAAFAEIRKLPAADVAEVVRGQWCVSKIRSIETVFYCSECKRTVTVGNDFFGEAPKNVSAAYPYCHCGAKMDGGNDDATD
jgi:hypothetical protein